MKLDLKKIFSENVFFFSEKDMMISNILKINIIYVCLFAFLFLGCSNDKATEGYGVSISAPSIPGTSAEAFSDEQIEWFRISNGLSTDLVTRQAEKDSILQNLAFSPIFMLKNLFESDLERDYLKALEEYCNVSDTNSQTIMDHLGSVPSVIFAIDSTITIESCLDTVYDGIVGIRQFLGMRLLYEDALQTEKAFFSDVDFKKSKRDFFGISGNFSCFLSSEELVVDVPLSEGDYTLLLIQPVTKSLRDYVSGFSERKYADILDKMEKRKVGVKFPSFEGFTVYSGISLPEIMSDGPVVADNDIHLECSLSLLSPTRASLKERDNSIEEKMIYGKNREIISFDTPFMFIIRELNSRLILLQGLYVR